MRYLPLLAGISLLTVTGIGQAAQGEFGKQCTMGLAMQQHVDTDCSVNWTGTDDKTYCFGNEEAKATFLKDPEGNLKKAQEFYEASQKE